VGFLETCPKEDGPPLLDTQYCHVAGGKLTIFTDNAAQAAIRGWPARGSGSRPKLFLR